MTTMLQTYCKNIEGKGLVTTSIFSRERTEILLKNRIQNRKK
jgi:hypothetical protein